MACVNVVASQALTEQLTTDYLKSRQIDLNKNEFYLYQNVYLTDDASGENHEYAYASRLKLLAAINAQTLDLVLMNREAYDAFSQNGYLYDLTTLFQPADSELYDSCKGYLITNTVILGYQGQKVMQTRRART